MQKSYALALSTLVFAVSITGCSKTVKNEGSFLFPITESPSPIPSGPVPSPSPSVSPVPSPSPTPSHDPEACAEDPFGELKQFSNFSTSCVSIAESVAESRVGGVTVAMANVNVATKETSDRQRADVVADRSLQYLLGSVPNGRIAYGSTINAQRIRVLGGFVKLRPLDFADLGSRIGRLSAAYATQANVGTVELRCEENPGKPDFAISLGGKPTVCSLNLNGPSSLRNVFNVDVADLQRAVHVNVVIPPGSTALVNIHGAKVVLNGTRFHLMPGVSADGVLWNFPETTSVKLSQVELPGSVLAPKAGVTLRNVRVHGGVLSHDTDAAGTLWRQVPFAGCLPIVEEP